MLPVLLLLRFRRVRFGRFLLNLRQAAQGRQNAEDKCHTTHRKCTEPLYLLQRSSHRNTAGECLCKRPHRPDQCRDCPFLPVPFHGLPPPFYVVIGFFSVSDQHIRIEFHGHRRTCVGGNIVQSVQSRQSTVPGSGFTVVRFVHKRFDVIVLHDLCYPFGERCY